MHIAIALCDEGDMECDSYFDESILSRSCWSQKDPVKAETEEEQLEQEQKKGKQQEQECDPAASSKEAEKAKIFGFGVIANSDKG